jgi:hypothetical protein
MEFRDWLHFENKEAMRLAAKEKYERDKATYDDYNRPWKKVKRFFGYSPGPVPQKPEKKPLWGVR